VDNLSVAAWFEAAIKRVNSGLTVILQPTVRQSNAEND
jgi:hypothetical protein